MPIKIQSDLPAKEILEKENIFVMDETRALHQDIRPIRIFNIKSDAAEGGDGAAASAFAVQYTVAGGCDLYGDVQP